MEFGHVPKNYGVDATIVRIPSAGALNEDADVQGDREAVQKAASRS